MISENRTHLDAGRHWPDDSVAARLSLTKYMARLRPLNEVERDRKLYMWSTPMRDLFFAALIVLALACAELLALVIVV